MVGRDQGGGLKIKLSFPLDKSHNMMSTGPRGWEDTNETYQGGGKGRSIEGPKGGGQGGREE